MATYYWVGGTGTLDATSTAHLSTSSGGTAGAGPCTTADSLIVDANSGTGTITIAATAAVGDMTVTWTESPFNELVLQDNFSPNGVVTINGRSATNRILVRSDTAGTPRAFTTSTLPNIFNCDFRDIYVGGESGSWYPNELGTELIVDPGFSSGTNWYPADAGVIIAGGVATFSGEGSANALITNVDLFQDRTYEITVVCSSRAGGTVAVGIAGVSGGQSISGAGTYTFRQVAGAGSEIRFVCTYGDPFTGVFDSLSVKEVSGLLGDCGGNSGIIFTTPETQTATGTGGFTWSTHGWTSRVPLPQDDVVIPNAFAAGQTIVVDQPRLGAWLDCSAATGSPTMQFDVPCEVYGPVNIGGVTPAGTESLTIATRGYSTLTSNGKTFTQGLIVDSFGGAVTLNDNLVTAGNLERLSGTFSDGGYDVTAARYSGVSGQTYATGNWSLTGDGVVFEDAGTFGASGYPISLTNSSRNSKTFAGGNRIFASLELHPGVGGGSFNIEGSNAFIGRIIDYGTAAHSIKFEAGSVTTATTFSFNGADADNLRSLDTIDGTGNFTLVKSDPGEIRARYLRVTRSIASPSNQFFALHSIDGGSNSGWTFEYLSSRTYAVDASAARTVTHSQKKFAQDPEAALYYTWDWSDWLEPGDTITSATITSSDMTVADGTVAYDSTSATAALYGGTEGARAVVTCHIVTLGGREDDLSAYVKIKKQVIRTRYTKDPDAILDYLFDWFDWLTAEGSVDLECTCEVTSDDVTISNVIFVGETVRATISGGTLGSRATIVCKITTPYGLQDARTVYLKIKSA